MISAKSGDHAGQSEVLTHDSALYNPHNISMQMYYTEVDDGAGKKRKVPVTWSHPHFPHEGQDKIMQKVEVSFGSTKATMMKEVDAGTPTVVHPPKNLLDPSGGLAMNAADGSQIILPSTEAVESLRDGIRPLVTNEERQKFYNEALSPVAQKIMSPDRVQCLCDDFAAGEKVKCN